MAVIAVSLAYFNFWADGQEGKLEEDFELVSYGRLDVHEWPGKIWFGPIQTDKERVTRLQINHDPHWVHTEYLTYYNKLEYLETISYFGDSDKISRRVMDAFRTFPRLKTIRIMSCRRLEGQDPHYDGSEYYGPSELASEGYRVIVE